MKSRKTRVYIVNTWVPLEINKLRVESGELKVESGELKIKKFGENLF